MEIPEQRALAGRARERAVLFRSARGRRLVSLAKSESREATETENPRSTTAGPQIWVVRNPRRNQSERTNSRTRYERRAGWERASSAVEVARGVSRGEPRERGPRSTDFANARALVFFSPVPLLDISSTIFRKEVKVSTQLAFDKAAKLRRYNQEAVNPLYTSGFEIP